MKKNEKSVKERRTRSEYSLGSNYLYVYSNLWRYDKSLILYSVVEIIFNVLMPLGAVIIPSIVFGLLGRGVPMMEFIRTIILVFLAYSVIAAVHAFLIRRDRNQYIDVRCSKFLLYMFRKCLHMDYHQYENEKVRVELEKAGNCVFMNTRGLESFIHHNVTFASNFLGAIAYAAIISFIHPVILLLLLLICVVQLIVFHRAKMYEHHKKDEMSKIEVTQNYLQEQAYDLKAGKDIRLYQLNKLIDRVYYGANQKIKRIRQKIRGIYYVNDMVSIILQFIRDAVCYGYLLYLLMHGLEVSYFVFYIGIVSGLASWIMKITEDVAMISRENLSICDFRSYIDKKDIFKHQEGRLIEDGASALDIVFDHVSFRYEGTEDEVLRDISFHIKKGERIALVGINGAGKSTIVKLMCGFYRPTSGRILINGIDIKELNIEDYFRQIAVVFQDALTLSLTIGENISGKSKEETDKELLNRSLELSGLNSKIDRLPKGTDTYLNKDMEESGIQLSGGELQKLMLARALYKNAKLLLLDEPTAALDAIAESELYEQYQRLLQGRTALFISHRLASTRFCSHILFLEDGRIVEEGTHDTLMQQGGRYANMFRVQSQYYKEGKDYEASESLA